MDRWGERWRGEIGSSASSMDRRPTSLLFIVRAALSARLSLPPARRGLSTEPTAIAMAGSGDWKQPRPKGWKKRGTRSWGCGRRGGRAKEPNGRRSRHAKKKTIPGHGDRGAGARASGIGTKKANQPPQGYRSAQVKHRHRRRQNQSLSLPPAYRCWPSRTSPIPTETTKRTWQL